MILKAEYLIGQLEHIENIFSNPECCRRRKKESLSNIFNDYCFIALYWQANNISQIPALRSLINLNVIVIGDYCFILGH